MAELHASINDYIYPKRNPSYSNYGTVGLIQMPSARFQNEGAVGFSWSNHDPYLRGSIIAYPFDWMEAVYSYTDINNALYSNVESFSGNQSYKDKGFDLKLRVLKESQFMPNVAIGLRDLAGSNNFEADSVVKNAKEIFLKNTKDNQLFDPQNANPSYSQDTKFKKINE